MKTITGVVVGKRVAIDSQIVEQGLTYIAIPYSNYYFRLGSGKEVDVSKKEYDSTEVGDFYTGSEFEMHELVVGGVILVVVLLFACLFFSMWLSVSYPAT